MNQLCSPYTTKSTSVVYSHRLLPLVALGTLMNTIQVKRVYEIELDLGITCEQLELTLDDTKATLQLTKGA